SSHVYQLTLTPISDATSSRRRPGVRRRQSLGRPKSAGESAARRDFRKRDSSALWSSCDTVVPSPVPIAVRKPRSDACPVPRLGAPARRTTRYREASVRYFVVLYINSGPFRIRSTTPMG